MKKLIALLLIVCLWMIYTFSSACSKSQCEGTPAPSVDFYAEKTVVNPGDWVNFGYSGSDDVESFEWSFPGGSPATSKQRFEIVIYEKVGTYSVSLKASNKCKSASRTKDAYIQVKPYKDGEPRRPKVVNIKL